MTATDRLSRPTRRAVLSGGGALICVAAAGPAAAREQVWTNFWGLALRGYDPVAYFDEGAPVEGDAAHGLEWRGAQWRFASAERRQRFIAEPERYAPRYGGHCAWAMANGYFASSVPEAWDVVDGKLYLNYSLSVRARWRTDVPGNIQRADVNWPRLSAA